MNTAIYDQEMFKKFVDEVFWLGTEKDREELGRMGEVPSRLYQRAALNSFQFIEMANQGFDERHPLLYDDDEIAELMESTGFCENECYDLIRTTGWSSRQAIDNVKYLTLGAAITEYSKQAIIEGVKKAGLFSKMAENLSALNTMRGGTKGFKGFVFEEMHAANASSMGNTTFVLNNNGIADFEIISSNGKITYAQAKLGYKTGQIDFTAYKGQTLVVDKNNIALIKKAKEAGLKVVESDVSGEEAARIARQMQFESNMSGEPNAIIVPRMYAATSIVKEAHNVGMRTARSGAQFGFGFSAGSNLVDVLSGEKDVKEASKDVAVDTAISAGVGYGAGFVTTVIGNTTAGAAAVSMASTAATAVGSTTVGGVAIAAGSSIAAAGSTAVGVIGGLGTTAVTSTLAAGTAVGSTVAAGTAAVGSTIAGTSAGGAVVAAGSALAGTAVGGTVAAAGAAATGVAVAAGTAVAAAAVAAAPVVAVGAAVGAVWSIGRKIFGR